MVRRYEAPWLKLVGGLGIAVSVGAIFSFGALSPAFMKLTHSTSEQAASIGLGGNVGFGLYLIPGLSFDRYGTRFGFMVGVCLLILGFGATCAALSVGANYLVVAVTWAAAGHAMAWLLCTNLLSNVKSWKPEARGYAVGSLQSFFCMSAPLFISIWENKIFDSTRLVPFLAFIVVWTLIFVSIAVICGGGSDDLLNSGIFDARAAKRFSRLQVYIAALLLLIVATGLAQQTQWASYTIVAAIIFGVPAVLFLSDRTHSDDDLEGDDVVDKALSKKEEEVKPLEEPLLLVPKEEESPTQEPLAALGPQWMEFWELFLIFGILTGGALSTSISMVSIARSVGTCEYKTLAAFSLTLLTASDAFARMVGGVVINAKFADGSVVLAVGALFLGASHTAFSAAHGLSLHEGPYSTGNSFLFLAAAAMSGLADGCAWTSCPWLTQARFGATRYGNNFGIVTVAAVVGIIVFIKAVLPIGDQPDDDDDYYLVAYNHTYNDTYTIFNSSHHPNSYNCASIDDDDDKSCYGGRCFSVFHRTCQATALVAFVCALDLERRRLQAAKQQQQLDFLTRTNDAIKQKQLKQRNNNNNV